MPEKPDPWLAKKLLDECSLAYRTIWDLYLKFDAVFLTANLVGLGFTVQYVDQPHRWPIVMTFLVQNVAQFAMALWISKFSKETAKQYDEVCKLYVNSEEEYKPLGNLARAPLAGWIGAYGGYVNAAGHAAMVVTWFAILFMKKVV